MPCGAGAGGLTLLTLFADLRRARLIPQQPLSLKILGGDISAHALGIYSQLFTACSASIQPCAITAELSTQVWDATSVPDTNQLCDNWFAFSGSQVNEYLVLVTNFSGAGTPLINRIRPALDHIMARISNKKATLLWIEPGGDRGRGFLTNVARKVLSHIPWFRSAHTMDVPISHEFMWWHNLISRELPGSVAVHRYERLI